MLDRIFDKSFIAKAIYGSITLLAVLLAMESHPPLAWQAAITLFGTALAVTIAEVYSETIAATIAGEHELSRMEMKHVWQHARPILLAANIPTLVLLLSAVGLYSMPTALFIAKTVIYLALFIYGARAGRLSHGTMTRTIFSGLFAVGIGALIGVIKVIFH